MLWKYLFQAYKGKLLWLKIQKKYGEGYYPSRYILFPGTDIEFNAWGLFLMKQYLDKNHYDKVMILSDDNDVAEACKNIKHKNLHFVCLTKQQMQQLIRFYGLVNMNNEWTVVSVTEPYSTGAEHLLGINGVTKKEIVWYDVYRMTASAPNTKQLLLDQWLNADKFIKSVESVQKHYEI